MDDPIEEVISHSDDLNPNVSKEQLREETDELRAKIQITAQYHFYLTVYRLIKNNYVKLGDLAVASGYSRQRLLEIYDAFEKKIKEDGGTPTEE